MEFLNHSGVMSSEYDNSFRLLVTAGWADEVQGEVDSPVGHLSKMFLVHRKNFDDWRLVLMEEGLDVPSAGRYLVHENNMGIVVVFTYDSESDLDKDWESAEKELAQWYAAEEESAR